MVDDKLEAASPALANCQECDITELLLLWHEGRRAGVI